jgi:hypothetical protein
VTFLFATTASLLIVGAAVFGWAGLLAAVAIVAGILIFLGD